MRSRGRRCRVPPVVRAGVFGGMLLAAPPELATQESPSEADTAAVGRLTRVVDARALRGEAVRLRVALRSGSGAGFGWLRFEGPSDARNGGELRTAPAGGPDWSVEEIRVTVPPAAVELRFGVLLVGEGPMWADDVQLAHRRDDGTWRRIYVENADAESVGEGGRPAAWGGIDPPFRAVIDRARPYEGEGSIRIERRTDLSASDVG